MSAAELRQKKLDLIAWINDLSDEHVITFLDDLRTADSNLDWWDNLSSSQQQRIKKGMKDVEMGNVLSSTEFWNALKNG